MVGFVDVDVTAWWKCNIIFIFLSGANEVESATVTFGVQILQNAWVSRYVSKLITKKHKVIYIETVQWKV